MPVHDWSLVDAGIFHDFHNVWTGTLRTALNSGLPPTGYYALTEQHAGKFIADVLTLHAGPRQVEPPPPAGGMIAMADAPPKVRKRISQSPAARVRRKTVTIRHVSAHQIVALVDIVSPANKDRPESVRELVAKVAEAVGHGIHVLLVDLLPPGPYDPRGMHGAVWEFLDEFEPAYELSADEPLTLVSYVGCSRIQAVLEHVALGRDLPEMPLFLSVDHYVNVPLESTYRTSWDGVPEYWRNVLEGGET